MSTHKYSYQSYVEEKSEKDKDIFFDINKIYHKFPNDFSTIGFPVTLLHKHPHAHGYLIFNKDFSESNYTDAISNFSYPCSWYLDNDENIIAYEFCTEEIKYDLNVIKERLYDLKKLGYKHYGTTVREITDGIIEFETLNGHIYINKKEYQEKTKPVLHDFQISQTVIFYEKGNDCPSLHRCVKDPFGEHVYTIIHRLTP